MAYRTYPARDRDEQERKRKREVRLELAIKEAVGDKRAALIAELERSRAAHLPQAV